MSHTPDRRLRRALGIAVLAVAAVPLASCGDTDQATTRPAAATATVPPTEAPEIYRVAGVDPPKPDTDARESLAVATDQCDDAAAGDSHVQDTRYR